MRCRKECLGAQGSQSVGVASGCPATRADLTWALVTESHLNYNKRQAEGLKPVCYIQAGLGLTLVDCVFYVPICYQCRTSDLKLCLISQCQ